MRRKVVPSSHYPEVRNPQETSINSNRRQCNMDIRDREGVKKRTAMTKVIRGGLLNN